MIAPRVNINSWCLRSSICRSLHMGKHPCQCRALRASLPIRQSVLTVVTPHIVSLTPLCYLKFIIMAMHARPVPYDPYNPVPPLPSPGSQQQPVLHPSPYIPIRFPVFVPVIFINDCIVRILSLGTRGGRSRFTSGGSKAYETAESVEKGEGGDEVELRATNFGPSRVGIGGRAKILGDSRRKID